MAGPDLQLVHLGILVLFGSFEGTKYCISGYL